MVHAGGEVAGAPLLTCSPSPCSRDGTPPSLAVCVRPSHDRSSAQLDGWPTAQRRWGCRSGGGRLGNPHRKHAAAADPCQALSAACANHCVNPDLCMQLTAVSPTLAKTMRLSACWCQQHCRPRSAAVASIARQQQRLQTSSDALVVGLTLSRRPVDVPFCQARSATPVIRPSGLAAPHVPR